ncbi:MAG TPA: hypothetical protein VGS22_08215 [Thermoanaerobaculia bacterium]|jgi:photosystem II stability/assembly factor-like uncharacterized protein|nr:hypothetical protein [Thermoanaerobaculia bacterium]
MSDVKPTHSNFRSLGRALLALVVVAGISSPAQAVPRWVSIGPIGGVVTQLAQAASEPSRLYASTYPSGLYRSRDGGRSWQAIDRGIEGLEIRRIGVDPRNSNVVLANTQGGQPFLQVWRSDNGGTTWVAGTKPPRNVGLNDFSFDAVAPRTVYAATTNGIFRSLDGGSSWNAWALPETLIVTLAQDPDAPAVRFASGRPFTGLPGGIYKSTDGGVTWTTTPSAGGPGSGALPDRLFFRAGALYAVWNGALYRSTDDAGSWTLAARLPSIGANDFQISPSGTLYAATYVGVYSSTDGVHWSPAETTSVEQSSPRDSISGLALLSDDTAVATGRRGAWRSTDGGRVWRAASRGLAVRIVGGLIVVPNPQGTVLGSFEEGLFRTERDEGSWQRLPRQVGFEAPALAPDPHRPGRVYALGESPDRNVGVSDDLGKTWRPVGDLLLSDALLLRVDPFHENVLFAGTELGQGSSANGFAYRSGDGGATWTEILGFDYLLDLAFDPAHRDVVFRATFSGIDKSTDDGRTWAPLPDVRAQLLGAYPTSLLFDPRSHALYVGTDQRGIFRSTDDGRTFRRINGGLPRLTGGFNPFVGSLVQDAAGEIYAGLAQAGVFRLRPGNGWTAVNLGLPLATFNGRLIADPARPGLLYAATSGSSVLRLENP